MLLIWNNESFENFFEGSKSFTNKVYNQQFKGTLRPLRRLFSLTPISSSNDGIAQEPQQIADEKNKGKSNQKEYPFLMQVQINKWFDSSVLLPNITV